MSRDLFYDVIIIGGGPAGLTAGLYVARSRLKSLLIEKGAPGGQVLTTEKVENYPGFPDGGVGGLELMQKMQMQAQEFGLQITTGEVKKIDIKDERAMEVETREMCFFAHSLIVATGAEAKKLNIPGEDKFLGRGISFCATCDAPFFKDKKVAVVGGGDTAVEEALYLTKFVNEVYLVHRRGRLRAAKVLQERALSNPKIKFFWDSVITGIIGEQKVEKVRLRNIKTNKESDLSCDGVFIFIGVDPNTVYLKDVVQLDEQGYIITNENMQTSCPAIFACGDARRKLLRQVVTACGDGAAAAYAAQLYVEQIKGIAYR
jgi:thioredoxin reductase (NADPH)